MFGFLKKKLQEGIDKISKVITEKEEEKIEEAVEEVKQEEHLEQPKEEIVEVVERELEKPSEISSDVKTEKTLEEPAKIPEDVPEKQEAVPVADEVKISVSKEPEVKEDREITSGTEEKLVEALHKFEKKLEVIEKEIEEIPEVKPVEEPVKEEPKPEFREEVRIEIAGETPKEAVVETMQPEMIEVKPAVALEEPKEEIKPLVIEEPLPVLGSAPNIPENKSIEVVVQPEAIAETLVEAPKADELVEEAKPEKKKRGFLSGILKRKPKKEEPKIEKIIIEEKPAEEPKPEEDLGILEKIKKKITEKKIEEEDIRETLNEIEIGLITSDVAVEAAYKIVNDLRGNLVGKFIKKGEIESVIRESIKASMLEILNVPGFDILDKAREKKPLLVVFLGFNGVGKTTSIARIGHLLKTGGISCVFAAGDSWRAAAIEQLEEHGRNLGIDVIKHRYGADPAAVIFDAVNHAKSKNIDVILADTAGRSHSNANLMDELKKIIKVNKPDLKILVLDALTGNDIYDQCRLFNDAVGVDGMILTKADVYEKGGAALAAAHTIGKPIIYMGVGQEYGDLEKFDSKKIVEKLLE